MTFEAMKAAIEQLSESDRRKLADWFDEIEGHAWDERIRQDFGPGGRGWVFLKELQGHIDEGWGLLKQVGSKTDISTAEECALRRALQTSQAVCKTESRKESPPSGFRD